METWKCLELVVELDHEGGARLEKEALRSVVRPSGGVHFVLVLAVVAVAVAAHAVGSLAKTLDAEPGYLRQNTLSPLVSLFKPVGYTIQ